MKIIKENHEGATASTPAPTNTEINPMRKTKRSVCIHAVEQTMLGQKFHCPAKDSTCFACM